MIVNGYLVGGDWNHGILWLSHHIGNVMIPIYDFFFRGVGSTTNQITQTRSHIITDHHISSQHLPWFSKGEVHGDGNARTTRCMQMWRSQTKKHMGCSRVLLDHRIGWWENFNRKALYLMVKTHGFPVNFPLNQSSDWKNLCAISCLETASCFYWHVRIRNNFAHGILVFWETFRKTSRKKLGRTSSTRFISKKYCVWGKKRNDCGCNFKFVAFLNAAC